MADRSDTEVDFSPADPAELAILNMDIAAADTLVAERLAECGGDPLVAFTFNWLSSHSSVLWLQRKLGFNFSERPSCLLGVVESIDTWVIDYDTIQDWTQKTAHFWTAADTNYRRHQALLLCYSSNRSGIEPPGDDGMVYSAAVVWVLHDQSRVTVPQAVKHLRATAVAQREETAVLCHIPESAPYWASPADDTECNLVQLNNNVGSWFTSINRVRCYRCITHHLQSTMRTFVALSKDMSGRDDMHDDAVAFYYVEPRTAMWPCSIYAATTNEGDLLPALNVVPLETTEALEPPPPPVPRRDAYPPPNPDLEQDIIKMMGPTVGQLEVLAVDDSLTTEEPAAADNQPPRPQTPDGVPPIAPPGDPPRRVVIKTEPTTEILDFTTDNLDVSSSLTPLQPEDEEGAASDTTFAGSVGSTTVTALPLDHNYPTFLPLAPDGADDVQQPTFSSDIQPPNSSTVISSTPTPSTVPTRTVVLTTPGTGRIDSLCSLPLAIIRHSAVLDAAYKDLMTKFFDRLRLAHAERLTDLNTCRTSVSNAVRKWTKEVQTRAMLLGSNPGVSSYNVAIDTVRLLSDTLRRDVNNAEGVFLASKAEHDAAMEEHAAEIKQMLEVGIRDAIQAYLQGCVASCLAVVGDAGNLDPWLAQFTMRAMDFQSLCISHDGGVL